MGRLVVLVPTIDGKPEFECEQGLRALERQGIEVRRSVGCASIDLVRSRMATRALVDGFDELLWIDDDVVFDPQDVERLRKENIPLVAGPYAKRGGGAMAFSALPECKELVFGPLGGLTEVEYVGTGFLYTRREVYDTMAGELPVCDTSDGNEFVPYFLPFVVERQGRYRYLAEDFAFCERARRAGYRILIDTRIRLFHVGTYRYGWEDAGRAELPRHTNYRLRLVD